MASHAQRQIMTDQAHSPRDAKSAHTSIAVYLDDDLTGSVIAPVLQAFGYSQTDIHQGGIDAAILAIGKGVSPELLFVDLGERPDPRADIQALADVCPPGTIVVALGTQNDVSLYRDLIHLGVQDYLLKPANADVFADTLEAALEAAEEEDAGVEISPDLKRTVVVTGVRGGLGTSTLAANLAWAYASESTGKVQKGQSAGHPTILVDMDLVFGTGAMQFDLEPGRGLIDALLSPGRVDGLFIDRAAIKAREKLSILAAEAPLNGVDGIQAESFDALFDTLADAFQTIIVDQPRATLSQNMGVLGRATDIVLVTDHSLAAARDCIRMIGYLKQCAPGASVHLVVTAAGIAMPEVADKDFVHSVEKDITARLPHDPKACLSAAQKGKVLLDAAPQSKLAGAIRTVKKAIDPADPINKRPSLFAKLLGRA